VFYFLIIKNFLHQSLGYCFLNWMEEINFVEVYSCQPAKNIFEAPFTATRYFTAKNIRVKEQ